MSFWQKLFHQHTFVDNDETGIQVCIACQKRQCKHLKRHMALQDLGYIGTATIWICDICHKDLGLVEGSEALGGWRHREIMAKINAGLIRYPNGRPFYTVQMREYEHTHFNDTTP